MLQIVFCLITSIVLPVVSSSINLATSSPMMIFGKMEDYTEAAWRRRCRQVLVVCCSFLNPALLVNSYETVRDHAFSTS